MRRPLSGIKRRVERLATQATSVGCGGDHQRVRIVDVNGAIRRPFGRRRTPVGSACVGRRWSLS